MDGVVLIGGGGTKEEAFELDEAFRNAVFEREKDPTCLYIPHALEPAKHNEAYDWFQNSYSFFDKSTLLSSIDSARENYTAIYLGGGYTLTLMKALARYGLSQVFFQEYTQKGGVVYGGSAGGVVLGKSLRTARELMKLVEPADNVTYEGFDICRGLSFTPHFQGTESEKQKIIAVSAKHGIDIIALHETSGVVLSEDRTILINPNKTFIAQLNP